MGEVVRLAKAAELRRAAHELHSAAELKAVLLIVADCLERSPQLPPEVLNLLNREIAAYRSGGPGANCAIL